LNTIHTALRRLAAAAAIILSASTVAADTTTVGDLASHTHIHGLAIDAADPRYLFIATHHGLYRAAPDGTAELISVVQDFMGFSPHPNQPGILFASGHPAGGGNLGVIASSDGGKTWSELSPGVNGPVDFHQMAVSPADPNVIYGAFGDLQASRDGGKTWAVAAPLPDRLIDLAGSGGSPDTLYAATEQGLSVSLDGGLTWKAILDGAPVTLVEAARGGTLYAFVYGEGLVSAKEGVFGFETLARDWGDAYLLHLAVDPDDKNRLFAASNEGRVFASTDGGKTWSSFGE
jgi:photosystem II stability/assembly factor-like uncharacterized protein